MRLKDKAIIVTGGANGIGRTYCQHLIRQGAQVVIADLAIESAQSLANNMNIEIGERRAVAVAVDVTLESSVNEMASFAVQHFGKIDVLINNVGVYPHQSFEEISYEEWRRVITLNLDSVFLCSKAVVPPMKQQGAGKIINIATNLVWIGLPEMVHYIAAKAGIVGFTRALARAVGEHNITVNAIAPGAIIPPLQELDDIAMARVEAIVSHQALKWCQRPIDIVGALLFLASAESDFITGQILTVDGGLTTH